MPRTLVLAGADLSIELQAHAGVLALQDLEGQHQPLGAEELAHFGRADYSGVILAVLDERSRIVLGLGSDLPVLVIGDVQIDHTKAGEVHAALGPSLGSPFFASSAAISSSATRSSS